MFYFMCSGKIIIYYLFVYIYNKHHTCDKQTILYYCDNIFDSYFTCYLNFNLVEGKRKH